MWMFSYLWFRILSKIFINQTRDRYICRVCYEKDCGVLFFNCHHVCACLDCGLDLEVCPICKEDIEDIVEIKLS